MKKCHGPSFRAAQLDLAKCTTCRGRAVVSGVFHDLACVQCNASGWVSAENGEALTLEVLVTQLSIRLQAAEEQIAKIHCFKPASGPETAYEHNNRRGAGGSNYTGD